MRRTLAFLMFVIFFKPFSALVYVFTLIFTSLICVIRLKKRITSLDAVIIVISIIGSLLSALNVSRVFVTSGMLAAIFYVSFYWMVIFIILLDVDYEEIIKRFFGLTLTLGIPVILFAAAITGPASSTFNGYSTIPKLIGIDLNRVFFPFTGGVNHFGILLGFCLVVTSALKLNYLQILVWWISVFVLLAFIDSRGAVLALTAALVFSKSKFINPYVWVFVPVVMVALGMLFVSSGDIYFSRENSTLFSQREYLWGLGISGLRLMSWDNLLIGYGVNGFMSNSIASIVSEFFAYRNSIGSLHNAHLTVLYDYGLLGLSLIVILNFKLIASLKYLSAERRSLSLKCLIFLSISSATETVYSFNYIFILLTFMFITQLGKDRCYMES